MGGRDTFKKVFVNAARGRELGNEDSNGLWTAYGQPRVDKGGDDLVVDIAHHPIRNNERVQSGALFKTNQRVSLDDDGKLFVNGLRVRRLPYEGNGMKISE